MSLFDLTGKVAVITGSSRGIGRAIAEELAAHGAKVVISSRNQESCDEVAAAIDAQHGAGTALALAASISDKAQLEDLFARTRERLGPVDILVCNAASNPHYGSLDAIDDEQFRKVLDNNILSNHWLIQLALPDMRAKGDGAVIVISSIGGCADRRRSAPTTCPRRRTSSSCATTRSRTASMAFASTRSPRGW